MMNIIELLGLPFLACFLMVPILAYLGIHVLKREVIFIDITLAQMAAFGAVAAHILFGAHADSVLGYASALGATLVAAAFFALSRSTVTEIPLEAIIGVTYAIAAAATLFVVGVVPGGHVHVQEVLTGSILWTTWAHILACLLVFSAVGACLYLFQEPFNRISEDFHSARREGLKVVRWDFVFYLLLGVVITLTVRIAGVVVVFAFLIIPATTSALLTSREGMRLAVAFASGTVASIAGLLFSYYLDFSVGPSVALFLGVILVLTALYALFVGRATNSWVKAPILREPFPRDRPSQVGPELSQVGITKKRKAKTP